MTDTNEITEMRKRGDLEGAYNRTRNLINSFPGDRHALLAHGRSVKALMEKAADELNGDKLLTLMSEYADLNLTHAGDPEAGNRAAWAVRKYINRLKEDGTYNLDVIAGIIAMLKRMEFSKPHRYYSLILDVMLQVRDAEGNPWAGIADFISWWNLDNLLPEDFEKIRLTNGMMMPSTAERAYNVYYQILRNELAKGNMVTEAEDFLHRLDSIMAEHPEFQHTLYHKTRLLKDLGRTEEAQQAAASFVRRRPNDFWSWAMLGDLAPNDDIKLACYCRALTCRADSKFLGKLKQKTAVLLAQSGRFAEAKHEIEDIRRLYDARGWHLTPETLELIDRDWYAQTQSTNSNQPFYQAMGPLAETLLYAGMPETAIMITHINPQKQLAGFITDDRRRGYFSTKGMPQEFGEYQIYRIRFNGEPDLTKAARFTTCVRETDASKYEGIFYRREQGELKWRPGQAFGFVGQTFVDGRLLGPWADTGIPVELTSALYWHIKNNDWAWKAVSIRPAE
ncbi:MAG: hypothetical protein K2M87_07925 [Muribaculaceae bacterium]|nr:hypothetical protein [Muribaculaceae bacterium]